MNDQLRISELLPTLVMLSLVLSGVASAESDPTTPPQLEPVDFIDNARPQQNDPTNQRGTATVATGWGQAVFSPDSQFVATVSVPDGTDSRGEIIVWNVNDAKPSAHFEQPGRITVTAFSPDGKLLAVGPGGVQSGVKLVDTKTGDVAQTLPGPAARTNALAWSHDGSRLALASTVDKTVRVWNVLDKKFLKAYEPEASTILSLGYTKSDQLLAAGVPTKDRDGLAVFDVTSGKIENTLKGHKEQIEAATFFADSTKLTSVGWDAMVRIWDVAKGEESGTIKGHKKGIRTVAISNDGKRLATANEREFKLWDGEKYEFLADVGGENNGAKFLTISPNGAWMVSIARDGTARLWDVEKKTETAKLDRNTPSMTTTSDSGNASAARSDTPPASDSPEAEAIQSLAYSHDGKWIALAREDGRISLRHGEDGTVARELEAFSDVAACVAFSHDDQSLAAGSFDKSVKVWSIANGEQQAELTGHTNWVFSVAFSPDNTTLASGSYDKTVKLWNIAESKEIATLTGHTAGVRSVTFTIDGQYLISGSADRTAIVWSLADHHQVAVLKGHTAAVRAVACSPDGTTIATASEDASVKLWKTSDWSERASMAGTEGVMFWCLAFSPAGRTLAAGAFNGTVKLYDPGDAKERKTLQGPTEAVTAVAFAPGAREIIAGSIDKSLRRWKAETGAASVAMVKKGTAEKAPELKPTEAATALNAVLLATNRPVSSMSFSKNGKRLAVGTGLYRGAGSLQPTGSLQLWDVDKREKLWEGEEFKFGIPAIAFSGDEQRIAMGNFTDNFLRLIDAANGKQLKEIRGHRAKVTGIAYSSNGKYFATASLDRDVKLWDASTNKEIRTFIGHSDFVFSIAFSPDGKRLLSGCFDRTARVWDIDSGKELLQLKGHQGPIQQAVFSQNGSTIATASADGTVRLYDAATGDYFLTLRGHRNKVESVAFAPNSRLIATGSSDRTIRLWDPSSGTELIKLAQEGTVRIVLFTPDGKHLASGCDDKTVKLWEVTGFGKSDQTVTDAQRP